MYQNTLGKRIKFLREQRGITKAELMKKLRIYNLGRFESDERTPGADILIILSDFFEVSIDWLLTEKEYYSVKTTLTSMELTPEEIHCINLIRQLPERERIKFEGMIELKVMEFKESSNPNSSASTIGNNEKKALLDLA